MTQSTHNDGVEQCGSTETVSGDPCSFRPGNKCPHHADGSQGETEPADVPAREAFEQLASCIIDTTGFSGKEEDSEETQAAKAWINWADGGAAEYREIFGECPAEGCDKGLNGFDSTHCFDHQPKADGGTKEAPPVDADKVEAVAEALDVSPEKAAQVIGIIGS